MHGRMYDPRLGQFLSPDPEIQSPYGQGLNRFAYVFNSPLNNVDPSGFTSEAAYWEAGLGLGVPYTAGLAATLWSTGGGFAASAAAPAATGFMVAGPSAGEVAGAAAPAIATVTAVINTAIATSHQAVHQFKTPSASNRAAHARSVARGNNNNSAVSPRQEKPPVPTPAEPKRSSDDRVSAADLANTAGPYDAAASTEVAHPILSHPINTDRSAEAFETLMEGVMWLNPLGPGEALAAIRAAQVGGKLLPGATKIAGHHIFAQQFRKFFAARGIDIERYVIRVAHETTHLKGIHGNGLGNLPGKWNARWAQFIAEHPNATAKEIYQFGGRLLDEFGLNHLPIVPK